MNSSHEPVYLLKCHSVLFNKLFNSLYLTSIDSMQCTAYCQHIGNICQLKYIIESNNSKKTKKTQTKFHPTNDTDGQ